MGRNKRTLPEDNRSISDSQPEAVPAAKKAKKVGANSKKAPKEEKAPREEKPPRRETRSKGEVKLMSEVTSKRSSPESEVVKKSKGRQIYTDSSSSSESESDSGSGSDTESDSSGSNSSQASKPDAGDKMTNNVGEKGNRGRSSAAGLHSAKGYDPPAAKSSASESYHSDTEEEDKKRRKKQKETLKMQLNKKGSKRLAGKKQGAYQDRRDAKQEAEDDAREEEEEEEEEEECGEAAPGIDDVIDWPKPDISELIQRMEAQIPPNDNQKFDSRAAKLNWEKIAFGDYSKEECHDMWIRISKRIRRYRILGEMLGDAKEWATKPWTNFYKGAKKNRCPDMPSKPLSTFMIYYLENKHKVAEDNPGVEMTHVAKIISEMYKNLSAEEREKYSEKAATNKQHYEEKMAEFYRDHPEMVPASQPHAPSKTNSKEGTKGPRKPNSAFKWFYQEQLKNYAQDGSVNRKSIEEAVKERWKSLSDERKIKWINYASEDRERFEKEVMAYKLEHPDYNPPGFNKPILNKEERLIKERLSGKPIKPPNSGYSLFSREMLQHDADVKSKEPKKRMAEVSKKWKEMTESQKLKYEGRVKELQNAYKSELQSYLKTLSPEEREKELGKQKRMKKDKGGGNALKPKNLNVKSTSKVKEKTSSKLFRGEPESPPRKIYDLFLKEFLADRPPGVSEKARYKQAPKYWEMLSDAEKQSYQETLIELKQKYISDFENFLKGLSPKELKEFSLRKTKDKRDEEQMQRINGSLTDESDADEEKYESSSAGSDSDESERNASDSGKSKSASSSDDSED